MAGRNLVSRWRGWVIAWNRYCHPEDWKLLRLEPTRYTGFFRIEPYFIETWKHLPSGRIYEVGAY